MEIANPEHRDLVQRFWKSPAMTKTAGLKAVDLFDAIHSGDIKAVWIMATNPVDSLPNADFVREALEKCDLVVVSETYKHTDTMACADIVLPSLGWGEKDGTVTNSERRISRQRGFLPAPGEATADWWQFCEVAKRMGFSDGFNFENSAQIFKEYAQLCSFENNGDRDLDLSGLQSLSDEDYDALAPIQWPVTTDRPEGTTRFFETGKYFTKSGKAKFVTAANYIPVEGNDDYPLILNTGRIRDQWHTMTRTGRAARLSQHMSEPFVEIHPADAKSQGLTNADIATVQSPNGHMQARVVVTERQRQGSVFVPMHFTDRFAKVGRVDALVHAVVDPVSGQPASKSTPVSVQKYDAAWYGFAVISNTEFEALKVPDDASYWAKARVNSGVRIEMAGVELPDSWQAFVTALLDDQTDIEYLNMENRKDGQTRIACFKDDVLIALLFTSSTPVALSRQWACSQLDTSLSAMDRHRLLAGRPGADMPDKGAIICACMNVGVNDIRMAMDKGCGSVEAIGEETTAGTNCGSCISEIRQLLLEIEHVAAE